MNNDTLSPQPCPAGKCDAQLYAVAEFVFCPKCGTKNSDYHSKTEVPRITGTRVAKVKQQPLLDLETGVVKW